MLNVNKSLVSNRLQLVLNTGTDVNGNAVTVSRSISYVNPDATAENLMACAEALDALCDNTVTSVYNVQKNLLQKVESEEGGN